MSEYEYYELSDAEKKRRRRKRLAKKKARRRRKIKILIILGCMLLLAITLVVGLIVGVVKLIGHFTHKDKTVINPSTNIVTESTEYTENMTQDELPDTLTSTNTPITIAYATKAPTYQSITSKEVKAPYAVLMQADNSQILAGRSEDSLIYPASLTKVMTLIVAVEYMDRIPDTYTVQHDDIAPHIYAGASRAGFEEGETVPFEDLLYGLILPSGADAATAIANAVAGSEEAFASLMNVKCTQLGLTKTHFVNPSGLYDDAQVTTCSEMAMIMAYAMQNELCAKVLSTYQYTTTQTDKNPDGLALTSTMFSRMYGNEVENVSIIAGKTGYTTEAGNCMVSYAIKNGIPYVCVTASSTNKWHCVYDAFELYGKYLP